MIRSIIPTEHIRQVKRAYLAGAMEFARDGGVGWRQEMARWLGETLGHGTLDPTCFEHDQLPPEEKDRLPGLKRTDLAELRRLARGIVLYDLGLLLNQADYVICHWTEETQRGCGSAGEITMAAWAGKPVYLLLDYPREAMSTWMAGCTTGIFEDWESLKSALIHDFAERSLADEPACAQ